MTAAIQLETPRELFKELVERALERQALEPSPNSAFYLVNLLDEFVRWDDLAERSGAAEDATLAELYCQAVCSEGARRLTLFKHAGDLALFVAGFFAESLRRRPVGVDYYIRIGGHAYGAAAEHSRKAAVAALYAELAGNFAAFVEVLGEVSESCAARVQANLMKLYDRWLETGSERTAAVLRSAGLVVQPVTFKH